jgi:hypothetical protein
MGKQKVFLMVTGKARLSNMEITTSKEIDLNILASLQRRIKMQE